MVPADYGCIHPVFYVGYLYPHLEPVPALPHTIIPLDDAAAGECKAGDILYSYMGRSRTEYLVKWVGYPVFKST